MLADIRIKNLFDVIISLFISSLIFNVSFPLQSELYHVRVRRKNQD